jgi:hypothetical protein
LQKPIDSNITTLTTSIIIGGFSYQASSTADYLSIAVLIGHLVLALGHTAYLLIRRQSSGCWDTIVELLVLAQNSRPPRSALKNTGAGIKSLETFAKVAKVRVTRKGNPASGAEGSPAAHIELIFCEDRAEQEEMTSASVSTGIATRATWPVTNNQEAASLTDTEMESEGFPSQDIGQDMQALLGGSIGESPIEDLEIIQPDRLYG